LKPTGPRKRGPVGVIRRFNFHNRQVECPILSPMSNYRRALVPGGCFFFTVNLLERRQTPLVDQIAGLREAVATTRQGHPFSIDAFVVLPDHLHAVWTLPQGDSDLLRKDGIAIQETDMVEDGRRFRGKDALHR
jgi:hypothetical protein